MSETLKKIKNFKRQEIKNLLAKCTPRQQEFFNQMYVSVDVIPERKMDWAIKQCENTIQKNDSEKIELKSQK